jgi:hypothetical protein
MSPLSQRSLWKSAVLLGLIVFFSSMYFYEGGGWNQNSRFDLLRAILERQTLRIDAYQENTEDKAHFRGHYYSDKAPGLVFFSLPAAVVGRASLQAFGIKPESPRGEFILSYVVGIASAALPAALAAVCVFFLALRFGCGINAAAFGTLAMCLGTPLWAYASLYWAHALVGACLIFAFFAALRLDDSESLRPDFVWALFVGLAAGWATVTEYPAALASAILAFFALSRVWRRGSASRWRVVLGIAVGASLCAVVLFGYLYAAFGSFRPSYSYYDPNSFAFMQQRGYLGLTYPHPDRLLKLLFGSSRGLFFASPIALAAPVGLWKLWTQRTCSAAALVAGAIVLYYFLLNSSFYWWKSGLSFGPRYTGASLPFLCCGLPVIWERSSLAWRRVLLVLAAISVFVSLMVVSTTSQLSMQDSCPIVHSSWPDFWSGHLAANQVSMLTASEAKSLPQAGAFNFGELLGLHRLPTLLPLFAVWVVGALLWRWLQRRTEALRTASATRSSV